MGMENSFSVTKTAGSWVTHDETCCLGPCSGVTVWLLTIEMRCGEETYSRVLFQSQSRRES